MPQQQDEQIFHFILTVISVKMKVKFPCKMALEHAGTIISSEVSPSQDNKFNFNQEIRLRQQSHKMFAQISVCLITQKGAKYISGIIKIYHNELIRSENERVVVSLSKCLDTEAFCQLRVDKIIRQKVAKSKPIVQVAIRPGRLNSVKQNEQNHAAMPEFKSPRRPQNVPLANETKSQAHFPVTTHKFKKQEEDVRSRQFNPYHPQASFAKKGTNYSPKSKNRVVFNNSKNKNNHYEYSIEANKERDNFMEAEIYKENYQKIKQKYMRQAQNSKNQFSKRIALQNNQNNYKLQIVRLKLKLEEYEKLISQKNARLKQVSYTLSNCQQRGTDQNYLREQISVKQHTINLLEDTILTLSKQNDELKNINKEMSYQMEQKILILQNEIEVVNTKYNNKVFDFEREIKMHLENISQKDSQINRKNQLLQKQKKNVYQLQKNTQSKLFQFDSILQNERSQNRQKIEQLKNKLQESILQVNKLNHQKSDLINEIDKMKGALLKSEYQYKLLLQQSNNLKAQLEQYRHLKNKHADLSKEFKILSDQKVIIQRNYEKIISNKDQSLEQVMAQYKKQLQFYKKNLKELQQKNKQISTKLIENQGQLEITKNSLDKTKKSHQNLLKQYTEIKEKQKSLKKSIKQKQQQWDQTKKQYFRYKEKTQTQIQNMKIDGNKTKQQLVRLKVDYQAEVMKNEQLVEQNSQLNMELAKLKMTQQYNDEKYQKTNQSTYEKYQQFQKIIKQHENVIELLEEKIKNQKSNQKDLFNRLQKCDYEINMVVDKNDKINKQLKAMEERKNGLENNLKLKIIELGDLVKKYSQLQSKNNQNEDIISSQRDEMQMVKNDLQKHKKIIEILQKDYDKSKNDIITYIQRLSQRERQLEDKIIETKKDKDFISNLDSKLAAANKQYTKFKESVSEAISNSFTQLIQNFSINHETKSSLSSIDFSNMSNKKGLLDMGFDLVNTINLAGRQNKNQIQKLTQKNRSLERDIELLRNQINKQQQAGKKINYQKSSQIEELIENIHHLQATKNDIQMHYQTQIHELQQNFKKSQEQYQNTQSIRNELQFSLSSLKMQYQSSLEQNEKKITQLKKLNNEMEEKLEYQYNNIQKLEKKIYEAEIELMNLNSAFILQKEQSYKKDLKIQQISKQRLRVEKQTEGLKKLLKQMGEQQSQLQIQYSTIKQLKQKYELMLNQEENKIKELRGFNSSIMKEKQGIIKKQLQTFEQINNLENQITEMRRQKISDQEIKTKFKHQIEELKDAIKKYINQVKEMQSFILQQKAKYNELKDKIREKQNIQNQLKEQIVLLKKKIEDLQTNSKLSTQQLGEEISILNHKLNSITLESSQNIQSLQSQIAKLTQLYERSKQEAGQLQQIIFVERQNNQSMIQAISKLKSEIEQYKKKLEQMQTMYEELIQQNRQKDEQMFQMGGKLYEYENRLKQMEEQKMREIEDLSNNMNVKYDQDYQQIYQKIEFIEKQKQYFKQKLNQKQAEINRKNQELTHKEIEQVQIKRMMEDKIKRLQEDKLQLFSDKNKELAKIMQENKHQFQNVRIKQSEIRKINHQLEISRNTILKLESRVKQSQNQKNNIIKTYQTQIQNLRKKQLIYKAYKDTVRSEQWNSQREIRKNIQIFIKKFLELGQKQNKNETIISLLKSFEQNLLKAIENVGKQ